MTHLVQTQYRMIRARKCAYQGEKMIFFMKSLCTYYVGDPLVGLIILILEYFSSVTTILPLSASSSKFSSFTLHNMLFLNVN